ncbi:hypothetical protein C7377_1557 [Balneicella halophila]|uniref:PPi-type phosphoenolpyruvate carboxykinase lobe 2 domain-containing protein n=1 Tax=Balneicella halophila TaxID=1537566 RepID=A0A7L4UNK7_BALHA|nr:hypothetical protein [Balneicella halophila]PVX49918.1 hypothetical protein C7377_1557 [Balneicella halophila]
MSKKEQQREDIIQYINMKLVALGFDPVIKKDSDIKAISDKKFLKIANNLIENYRSKSRNLVDYYCPADKRINNFLSRYFNDIDFVEELKVPSKSFILDQRGIARELSLPPDANEFHTQNIHSYRIQQGVLHNPEHDRRTTKGSFHIADEGLPVPPEKFLVPKITYAHLLKAALNPPKEMMKLPFTSTNGSEAATFVSFLARPIVSPKVEGVIEEKSLEVRFFVPGNFVSNLDFVESIFGNAGNPNHPENDAGLDVEHWTGHSGCVILAPHLTKMKKKDVGLPHYDDATERQRAEGMCWKDENELYNNGSAFKLTCRDASGVAVTLIADNYFGYSKKEIKTMITYSANLFGLAEEEHAGGAIAFPRKNLGTQFDGELFQKKLKKDFYNFEEIKQHYGEIMNIMPENYGVDKKNSEIVYIPENSKIDIYKGDIWWEYGGKTHSFKLSPEKYYIYPSGHRLTLEKTPSGTASWRLVSTFADGTFCHKPCTVSGGGKSEISKSLQNAIIYSPFAIDDFENDFKRADEIINYDYSKRSKPEFDKGDNLSILDSTRTLGSAIKLLTPSIQYTDEYNDFISSIPEHIKSLVLFVKRFYRPERHNADWKEFFTVDKVNGRNGKELIFNGRKILGSYLRVGFSKDGSWLLHKLRTDFVAASKIQTEDDITASIVIPRDQLQHIGNYGANYPSLKLTENCEEKFFQRPDEAIHRGYDKDAERDLSLEGNFTSNYEPLSASDAEEIIADAINFDKYTDPIKKLIKKGAKNKDLYFISPSHTRVLEDGSRSTNPRYLQVRPDLVDPLEEYMTDTSVRFSKKIPCGTPVKIGVDAVLAGRRNNPAEPEKGIRPLAVYNPIHYQELPELFMDFITSLTGKSPSTTGAGSEGALTKAPFNMLNATADLNNALLSYILTGYEGFTSAAGYIGRNYRFDHDISLLMPEIWSRIKPEERNAKSFIAENALEKLEDFEYNGKKVLASRLGYRINSTFCFKYMNRVFNEPQAVFTEEMLKPELQSMEEFVDGINNITETQQRVALNYFKDGSVEATIPPLKVLLHIMAHGHYENKDISDPELRGLFDREYVINSDWYQERLKRKQQIDISTTINFITYIKEYMSKPNNEEVVNKLKLKKRLSLAEQKLAYFKSDEYLQKLVGTIGADLIYKG